MREYNAKVDSNQADIMRELRRCDFMVIDVHAAAPFDILVIGLIADTWVTAVCLVEIKSPGGRLTAREAKFCDGLLTSGYDAVYLVAYSAADVLRWFGR